MNLPADVGYIDLAGWILYEREGLIEVTADGDPRLGRAHHFGAAARFIDAGERSDILHAMMLS
jgi:hypothetical protein